MRGRLTRFSGAMLCLCLCFSLFSLRAPQAAADREIVKVLATTSYTPVALMDVDRITAATSTTGIYLTEYGWYDVRGGYPITSRFGAGPVELSMTFATHDGFVFAGSVAVYLNNSPAVYTLSEDRHYLTLTREYDPMIWLPDVNKSPSDEYVDEGGLASFVATANFAEGFQWYACDPATGAVRSVYDIPESIEIYSDGVQSRMNIHNVPAWMDGWQLYCTFVGALGYSADSARATLHVKPAPGFEGPLATDETPAATEAPEESPTASPSPTPAPAHIHAFSDTWHYDETFHWRACSCGERTEQGAHSMVWVVEKPAMRTQPGLERGVCSVCGFAAVRELPYTTSGDKLRLTLIGAGCLLGLAAAALLVKVFRPKKRRR